jgi:hypothetical protein
VKTFVSTAMRAALPWVLLMLLIASHAHAQRLTPTSYDSDLKTVRALLQQPESQMDLGVIKLAVDRMIDPSVDVAAATKQIDQLAEEIRATFPIGASNLVKFKALRDYRCGASCLSRAHQKGQGGFEPMRRTNFKGGEAMSQWIRKLVFVRPAQTPARLEMRMVGRIGTCNTLAAVTTIFIPAADAVD